MQHQNSRPLFGRDNEPISLVVPACLGETFNQQLVELSATIGESIGGELAETLASTAASRVKLRQDQVRLRAVQALRDQLDWDNRTPEEAVTLTAERWLLHSVVHGTVVWLGDRIAKECHRPPANGFDADEIEVCQEQLTCALGMLTACVHAKPA